MGVSMGVSMTVETITGGILRREKCEKFESLPLRHDRVRASLQLSPPQNQGPWAPQHRRLRIGRKNYS
jgi:hypothetical protein